MNTWLMLLGVFALVMVAVSWHARRLGNEPRDITLPGASVPRWAWAPSPASLLERVTQAGPVRMPCRIGAACAALLASQAQAFDHRRAGDVLENALPAGVAAMELWRGDREGLWQFGASFAVTVLATKGLKHTVDASRPDGGAESFPSGHASKAFAAATYVHRRHGWGSAWPWYAAGAYVGWTRVNANRHRWGDIAGSLALAAASSWWLVEPLADKGVSVLPVIAPGYASVTVQARW